MQGSWNNGKPHYRCVYPTEYGLANHVQHPRSVYLREDQIVPRLDAWLAGAFTPDRLAVTVQTLVDAQADEHNDSNAARVADAKRIIAGWTAEVAATRVTAQAQIRQATQTTGRMTADEINTLVSALGSILTVLRDADPLDKAEVYARVGLQQTYQPGEKKIIAEARPPAIMYKGSCRRGDTNHSPTTHDLACRTAHCLTSSKPNTAG
jgi:hypothetical protein